RRRDRHLHDQAPRLRPHGARKPHHAQVGRLRRGPDSRVGRGTLAILARCWYAKNQRSFREAAVTTKKTSGREGAEKPKKAKNAAGASRAGTTAKRSAAAARPKIRASHATVADAPRAPRKRTSAAAPAARRSPPEPIEL